MRCHSSAVVRFGLTCSRLAAREPDVAREEGAVILADGSNAVWRRQARRHVFGDQAAYAIRITHDYDRIRGCGIAHLFDYSNLRTDLVGDVDDVGSGVGVVRSISPLHTDSVIPYGADNTLRDCCSLGLDLERD